MYIIRNGAIRWQMHDFLFVLVMFALSLTVRDIRKSNKMQSLNLKMKVKEEKHGTFAIRPEMFHFI